MLVNGTERRTSCLAEVSLEAGGDHRFDLGHLRRSGAEDLVRLLLHLASYRRQIHWRVRVEKKINCHGETRPITVVGQKPWCCYLKIKPGDNNTAHFCSLLMPDGYRGEPVYEALKEVEEQANRIWWDGEEKEVLRVANQELPPTTRHAPAGAGDNHLTAREAAERLFGPVLPSEAAAEAGNPTPAADVTPQDEVAETPDQASADLPQEEPADSGTGEERDEPDKAAASELRGWTTDADRLRLTLLAIHELHQDGKNTDFETFVTALSEKLGWRGLRGKQIGGIFTSLVRRGHIAPITQGSRKLSYTLTEGGREVIRDLLPTTEIGTAAPAELPKTPTQAAAPATSPVPRLPANLAGDPDRLTTALTEFAQDYAVAFQKHQEIWQRRTQLLTEVERLDAELAALDRVVNNPELRSLVERLLQLTGAHPPTARAP